MKNKSAKISTDQLFFSHTWNFLNVYLVKQVGRSQATAESYRDSLTIFKNYLVGELGKSISTFQFSDCTKECIYNFREYLLANGSQPSTVNVRVAAIRAYLNYASDMDISVQSVALAISQISPCKTIKKEKPILSDDALAAILSAPPNTKFGVRDRAILILLYDTAVRISELLNIRLCDIAMESKYPNIFITGKGNKERTIQLTAKAVGHLREYIRVYHSNSSKEAYLFSTTIKGVTDRMSVGNVQRIIKKYAALVSEKGVSLPDSVHCHMFRRTRATNLYQDGIAIELVSTVLGHARTDTTKSYYTRLSIDTTGYEIEGKKGTWLAQDYILMNEKKWFLMEHEEYGTRAAYVILSEDGAVVMNDCYNGFDEEARRNIQNFMQQQAAKAQEQQRQQHVQSQMQSNQIQQSPEQQKKKPELANWQKVMDNGEYLRSAEMAEEANYNMIDGLMNNTPKKKDKNAPRRSVLKRLRKHQQKIASQGKGQPQQQRAVEEEMERKKK